MDPHAYELPPCAMALAEAYRRDVGVLPWLPPEDLDDDPPCEAMCYPVALTAPVELELPTSYVAAVDADVLQPPPVQTFVDDYLRDVGVLPWLPPSGEDDIPVSKNAPAVDDADVLQPAPVTVHEASKNSAGRQQLCEYEAEIDANLRAMEKDPREWPSPDYLETTQGGQISPSTRASLVHWMGDFTRLYHLAPGTLHRAVSYVDRALSARAMESHHQLHLLGAVAVFTAAKYEERLTTLKLKAHDVAWFVGRRSTRQNVIAMESAMLEVLGYRLGAPTAYTFVEHFTRHGDGGRQDLHVQCVAHQLAERALTDYACVRLLPSAVAAAAIFLARMTVTLCPPVSQVKRWNKDLMELTGYKPMDLILGIYSMYMMLPNPYFIILPEFLEDPLGHS